MLKQDNFTREEIVAFLKLNIADSIQDRPYYAGDDFVKGINHVLEHLIDEFSDPNLAYNTETGFFDYTGPILPE
jgi:hypothetical protein